MCVQFRLCCILLISSIWQYHIRCGMWNDWPVVHFTIQLPRQNRNEQSPNVGAIFIYRVGWNGPACPGKQVEWNGDGSFDERHSVHFRQIFFNLINSNFNLQIFVSWRLNIYDTIIGFDVFTWIEQKKNNKNGHGEVDSAL